MQTNIVSYTFRNVVVYTAMKTDCMQLNELIVYMLGEKLIMGMEGEAELNGVLLGYLYSCLHPLDKPNAEVIYNEIRKRVEELSSELVYQNLLVNGEFYLKYDYYLGKNFTRIQLYVDPSESAWMHW